jgi:hypothetical protein
VGRRQDTGADDEDLGGYRREVAEELAGEEAKGEGRRRGGEDDESGDTFEHCCLLRLLSDEPRRAPRA